MSLASCTSSGRVGAALEHGLLTVHDMLSEPLHDVLHALSMPETACSNLTREGLQIMQEGNSSSKEELTGT